MPETRRAKCKRNRKQMGGAIGGVVTFAPSSVSTLINNPLAVASSSSCLEAPRPGFLSGVASNGLPGMSGGRRNRKSSRKSRKSRKQYGGAYGFTGESGIVDGFPGGASYPPVQSIGCTAPSTVEIPPSASGTINRVGGPLWDGPPISALQSGGGGYQLGETLKTAAYTMLDGREGSVIPSNSGVPLAAVIPVDGRTSGQTPCQKGGKRFSYRKNKKSRKSRKSGRKNKKSRKSRK